MDRKDWFWTLIIPILLVLIVLALRPLYHSQGNHVIVYRCDLAEISADIPQQVKEECRKLRSLK